MKFRTATTVLFICILTVVKAQKMPAFNGVNSSCVTIEVKEKNFQEEESTTLWRNEAFSGFNPSDEIIHLRNENTKHFRNKDGTISAFIGAGNIHYQEEGSWKTIFHTILETNVGFENTSNSHKTYYPKTANQSIKTILSSGEQIVDMLQMSMHYQDELGQKIGVKEISAQQGSIDFNKLIYKDVYGKGFDLVLTQNTTKRKMDYIINDKEALGLIPPSSKFLVFEEQVQLPLGWKAELRDNVIYLLDQQGTIKALYEKPMIKDSHRHHIGEDENNHYETLENNSITLVNENSASYEIFSKGILIIKTKVLVSWLKDLHRNFPIQIDPTLNCNPNNTANWTGTHELYSSAASSNLSTSSTYTNSNINATYDDDIFLGRYNAQFVLLGWSKFNITGLPSTACLTSASVNYYVNYNEANGSDCIIGNNLRNMNSDPSVAYNAANNAARLTDIRDGNIYATQNLALLGTGNGWKSVNLASNITDLTANIAASMNWFGVGFHTYEGAAGHTYCYIEALGYSQANKPYLVINYQDNISMGVFSLNGQQANIDACPGETITITHTGWNNGGGTVAYWVGIEDLTTPGWVTSWSIHNNACQNQNSCTFVVPSLATGTRLVVHSNGYNSCGWGPGVTRYVTINCCATTNAGTLQHQGTIQTLCHGQTVNANNITSTSLNAGNGTLHTVWFVGEWGWNGTIWTWINWRESTPGAPAGGVYSANLNTAVGGGNGDGQSMSNYNPQIDFPNNNRFYIIRGSYNPTCASWCVPACVLQGFEVIIRPPIPIPTVTNSGPICANSSITLTADGLAPQGKSLAATSTAAQMTIPNATLGANWTLEAWSRFPLNASGSYNTLFRNASGGGGGGDHQILCENGILGSWSNTGTNGPLGFKSSGFNVTTLSAGWHHIAAVASGGITKFYIDGTIVGQIAWQSDNSVQLINGVTTTQAWGEIDNVRIWNTARSVANILSDMHRNIPLLDLGNLIANYTFDGSNGNTVNNGAYNSTGIIDCAFNNVSYFTYTWTGTNAPAASTNSTQTVTNPATGTYSLIVSVNGCSSSAATTTITGSPLPTGVATQTFCSTVSPIIASLIVTGTAIQWYGTATGGSALPTIFGLSDGATYYATQTISGCESPTRLAVTVIVNPIGVSPAITGSTNLCWNGSTTLTPEYPTGGTVTNVGGYRIHTFTGNGTLTVPTGFSGQAEVLVVAGGGGGGGCIGGGGGAGGLQFSTISLTPGTKTVVIGAGGIGGAGWNTATQQGSQGGNSQFDAITSIGGGGGGVHGGASLQTNLWNGGSGGGAGTGGGLPPGFGTATVNQGKNGGIGGGNNGGGGGGFGGVGGNSVGVQACCAGGISGGAGGQGFYFPQFTANGSPTGWFAGGGGGGTRIGNGTEGIGGNGGGTNGTTSNTQATAAPANTGGGGGGGGHSAVTVDQVGGNGGSGIVIVRYYIGTPTWSSQNPTVASVLNGVVSGVTPGGSTTIDYTVAAVGGCPSTTVSIPVNVIGGQRLAPTGPQCSGTQLNFEALPNPSVSGTSIAWSIVTPSGLSASSTSGTSNLFSTTLTNSTSGTLQPTITVTQTLGLLTCVRNFTPNILAPPTVQVTCSSICPGGTTTVTATPTPAGTYTYVWTVPSGPNPGNVANFTTGITGTYSVVITNNSTNCSSTQDTCTINLQAQPSVIFLSPP